ncbi:MAG: hypothetical protein LBK00_01460 [Treponema sp.]|nr:hypothetical protein [Treponema sp.]
MKPIVCRLNFGYIRPKFIVCGLNFGYIRPKFSGGILNFIGERLNPPS